MIVEIDLDTEKKLSNGDSVEISGVVGSKKLEVSFLVGENPKFICTLASRYGWDVYNIDKTARHIESGTICTSLEYHTKSNFTLRFRIICDAITTTLNEKDLAVTQHFEAINEITSIKVSGDSLIKNISFSDFSSKPSRLLQPVIYQSLRSTGNGEDEFVTIIESRQRIVFKLQKDETDNLLSSEYSSDSDIEISETDEPHGDFNYIKKLLLSMSTSDNEEFHSQFSTPAPPNKYVISYFDPDSLDESNYKSLNSNFNMPVECKFVEMVTEERAEAHSKFDLLKSQTERIEQNLLNSSKDIENNRFTANLSVEGESIAKGTKRSVSYLRYNLSRKANGHSKIPVFKKSLEEREKRRERKQLQLMSK